MNSSRQSLVADAKIWALFCEDVRIEHDQRCTLVGVMPSVAIVEDEPFKLRQLCLVFSAVMSVKLADVNCQYSLDVQGDVSGLNDNIISGNSVFTKTKEITDEDVWQVITYIPSADIIIRGPARITARIKIGNSVETTSIKFFQIKKKPRKIRRKTEVF